MSVSITKIAASIKVDNGVNPAYYPVDEITHKVDGTKLILLYQSRQIGSYEYADITEPTGSDIEAVADSFALLLQDNFILISDVETILSDIKGLQQAAAVQLQINNKILSESYGHPLYTESDLDN